MRVLRGAFVLVALWLLAACSDTTSAPPEAIAQARFVSGEAPSLTIVTMKNRASDIAEHTGLLINGSEQVLFDPAGNYRHPRAPRSGDVHYGVTPIIFQSYKSFHARRDYYIKIQVLPVSLETADALIARAQAQGPTRQLFCAESAGDVLHDVAAFSALRASIFPGSVEKFFDNFPGVTTTTLYENDVGKN